MTIPQGPVGPAEGAQSLTPESHPSLARRLMRPAQVIIVTSVMFTFISYWRTAAVVLCDLASTAYYIGAAVENAIGPAAPWFILAVMCFSYAVRSVYIESSALFVRGGVYRVVKEAMGGFLAKLSVSALMFDYILTGPTSGVSAGSYIMGLAIQTLYLLSPTLYVQLGLDNDDIRKAVKNYGAAVLASLVTAYFFRQNLIGIHESNDKALKIMFATTVMAVIMLVWCGVTLAVKGAANPTVPLAPDLEKKYEPEVTTVIDPVTGKEAEIWKTDPDHPGKLEPALDENGQPKPKISEALSKVGIEAQEDPLGLLGRFPSISERLRQPGSWLSIIGVIGLLIAFGHSILAMSGEETLAQVYREVESPKLKNFKRAAFIVFVYSLLLTAGISFLAVMLIPDSIRMKDYSENLIGGLARHVWAPPMVKLFLEGFVVVVGFLILSGAVNTAIIGSNGVLNRVAEDGVLPAWFLKPHPRYGTTYRLLWLVFILQLATILISRGDMVLLTEAYAFGVVWSFVFKALAMVVLRFTDRTPREYKVPGNFRIGSIEVPFGLLLIFLILLSTALLNLFTKEVATVGGITFTIVFLGVFMLSEHYHEKKRAGAHHEHMEQFNQQTAAEVTPAMMGFGKLYRKLVAIRSPQNLFMLEKALAETDPETTGVVVMTAKVAPVGDGHMNASELDPYDQQLMTAVVQRAERAGKQVKPLIVPTNNPLHAVMQTAKDLQAHEVIVGASNKYTADEQMEQIAFYWISLHGGNPAPLTVRIMNRERDIYLDLAGGNRIPKISERRARSVAELRAAGVGVDRVLLLHDGTPPASDLFEAVLTMLDSQVTLALLPLAPVGSEPINGHGSVQLDEERARKLGRDVRIESAKDVSGPALVQLAQEGAYDLIILPLPPELPQTSAVPLDERTNHVLRHAHCRVFLASTPGIPQEVVDTQSNSR
jgi:amino acid transporter